MSDKSEFVKIRRRFRILGTLMLLTGLIVGFLLGLFGARHIFYHFRPDPNSISNRRANQLQKDFKLSDDTRDQVLVENQRFFEVLQKDREIKLRHLESLMAVHVENIARLLPNDAARDKWRDSFWTYFPPPPPPLKPMSPPLRKERNTQTDDANHESPPLVPLSSLHPEDRKAALRYINTATLSIRRSIEFQKQQQNEQDLPMPQRLPE